MEGSSASNWYESASGRRARGISVLGIGIPVSEDSAARMPCLILLNLAGVSSLPSEAVI